MLHVPQDHPRERRVSGTGYEGFDDEVLLELYARSKEDVECIGFEEAEQVHTELLSRDYQLESVVGPYKKFKDHYDKYKEWRKGNERVYRLFERFMAEALSSGNRRTSIWLVGNRVRWNMNIEQSEYQDEYKVNNNYLAYIVRYLIEDHPDWDSRIERRKVRYGPDAGKEV